MVALNESSIFEAIIRRIETTDPVQGGEPNPATGQAPPNIALMQLANRTRWLFDTIDAMYTNGEIDAAIAAAVGVLTAAEILTRIKTVDGDGSGLDADLLDGLHASAFWKVSDAGFSAAANGYQVLPSGIILQWGVFSGTTIAFPIAFPSATFNVMATDRASTTAYAMSIDSFTTSGFVIESDHPAPVTGFFTAIGN